MALEDIYKAGHTDDHETGLQAIWNAAVAETNRIRDQLASDIAGVDVEALQAENAALKAQVASLQAQLAPTVAPTPEPAPAAPAP